MLFDITKLSFEDHTYTLVEYVSATFFFELYELLTIAKICIIILAKVADGKKP